jgi:hypothetical protein
MAIWERCIGLAYWREIAPVKVQEGLVTGVEIETHWNRDWGGLTSRVATWGLAAMLVPPVSIQVEARSHECERCTHECVRHWVRVCDRAMAS